MSVTDPSDEDVLSAEYALGVLGARERAVAERRMRRDPRFAASVAAWQEHLGPLVLAVEPVAPPSQAWDAIETELGPAPARQAAGASSRRRVAAFWQWLALGSGGLAVASLAALFVIARPLPLDRPHQAFATAIAGENGLPLFAAVIDADTGSATLVPIRMEAGAARVPELWLIAGGAAPVSLGVVDPDKPLRIPLAAATVTGKGSVAAADAVLAISLEPQGGSPTGQPTGPVVGTGALTSI